MADYFVNEGSTCTLQLWFKDENDKNVVPTGITWRVDDVLLLETTGGELVEDTEDTPTTYKYLLVIPDTANIIIDRNNLWEEKLVTVRYEYGSGGIGTDSFRYKVKRMDKLIVP